MISHFSSYNLRLLGEGLSLLTLPLPYYERVFRSVEVAEDGCRDESPLGHRDASAAAGNPLPYHTRSPLAQTSFPIAEEC